MYFDAYTSRRKSSLVCIFSCRSPVGTPARGTFLSKLWPGKKSVSAPASVKVSHSWDSGSTPAVEYLSASQDSLHVVDDKEDNLPTPPPLPTLEYLLGKRPLNLRGKGCSSRDKFGADGKGDDDGHNSDIDSDLSSVSSTQGDHRLQQKKKTKKKKKRSSKEADAFDWQYNKLTVPQSSPPRERRVMTRKLTPPPTEPAYRGQRGLSSAFDKASHELDMRMLSDSPSSLFPLHSPSPKSPVGSPNQVSPSSSLSQITSYLYKSSGHSHPKRAAPVLPPHQQNRQGIVNGQPKLPDPQTKKTTPISLKDSSRKATQRKQSPGTNGSEQTAGAFMADLNQAIKSSSSTQPRVMRQLASPAGHYPSPINGIGLKVHVCQSISDTQEPPNIDMAAIGHICPYSHVFDSELS